MTDTAAEERELGWLKKCHLRKLRAKRDKLIEQYDERERLLDEARRRDNPPLVGWPPPERRVHLDEQVRIERRLAEVRTRIHRLEGEIRDGAHTREEEG